MFKDTNLFIPVINNGITTAHPQSFEYRKWWEEEKKRCIDGYIVDGVRITGHHYFYLNWWRIRGVDNKTKRKTLISPRFTDLDYEYYTEIEKARKIGRNFVVGKARQKGFEQPNSELVITKYGYKEMGNIIIGDLVYTHKNTLSRVIDVFPQGEKDVYELELMDGRKVRCGENHKWLVFDKKHKRIKSNRVLTTKELIDIGLTYKANKGKNIGYRFALPDIEAIEYTKQELPIDPYLLGLLLGDGTINKALKISSIDQEILESIQTILGSNYSLNFDKHSNCNYNISFFDNHDIETHKKYGKNRQIKLNPLKEEIKKLGLQKSCSDKFIPEIYINSSIEQRLELIRGLMDSDGHISKDGCVEFKNCSPKLSNDLVYILRSLGINCKIKEFKSPTGNKNYFRVYIRTIKYNLFKLKRKSLLFDSKKEIYTRSPIVKITNLGYKEKSTCILIADPDHIYLTRDFIPTHNSEKNACILAHEYTFFANSQCIVLAGEDKYTQNTMRMILRGLDSLKNTEFYKRRSPDTPDYVQAKYKVIEDGVSSWKGSRSEIYSITARNNPQAASGLSANIILMEEVGCFPNAIDTYKFLQPMIEAEGVKTGFIIMVGTGGDMDSGAKDLSELFFNPGAYDIMEYDNVYEGDGVISNVESMKKIGYFVPAWKFKITDDDGNSLKDDSIKVITDKRENARKGNKTNAYYTEITQNPLNPDEMFLISTGNFFNRDKLYKRLSEIRKNNELSNIVQKGDLEFVRDDKGNVTSKVEWKPNPNGEFLIFEHPVWEQKEYVGQQYNNLYFGATDSYDRDEANSSGSKLSAQVFKGILDSNSSCLKYVARYTGRPKTADEAYVNSAKLMLYYMAPNLIEYSNLGIFRWYKDNGLEWLLKERPRIVYENVKDSRVNNRYGVDPQTKQLWLTYYRDYIEQNTDKMFDAEQIEAAIRFKDEKDYNCDITISSALCMVHYRDNLKIQAKKKDEHKPFEFFSFKRNENGVIQQNFTRN